MSARYLYGTQSCAQLPDATNREWLVADGRGGYASGTIAGLRTRRYHGLLVVAPVRPAQRMMALASLDAFVTTPSGATVALASHEWASGAISPRGHTLLTHVDITDALPRWRWRVGDVVIERELAMRHGQPSLAVVHRQLAGPPVRLVVEPLCTWRDVHGERRSPAHGGSELRLSHTADGVIVEDAYRLSGPEFRADGGWYLDAFTREEAARGLNPVEDLFRVGRFSQQLAPGQAMLISAWAGDAAALATPPPPATDVVAAARQRAAALVAASGLGADRNAARLTLAADAFIVHTPDPDVVAGYPWFGAWSRDTMISYEGLFLAGNRIAEGRELLRGYAATLSEGMLANTADTGRTEYNTADATLWLLHAVARHVSVTGDDELADGLVTALDGVVAAHLSGTRYGIGVDPADCLLRQGAEGTALTWMDAVIDGVAVTPRAGKTVELNSLWINGLGALAALRERLGRDAGDLHALRARARRSFHRRFVNPRGWLRDLVDGPGGDDDALRPNQLFAYSLPYAPLRGDAHHEPVCVAARSLLTPLGLRSLAPDDPAYLGAHRGTPAQRDHAYHQGTVWPWLIGAFADAAAATGLDTAGLLDGLLAHLGDWGVGSVSETADGDAPHNATGCPFQAWSVAELLRIFVRQRGITS